MSRKIIDTVVESNKFKNYNVYMSLQSNPLYFGDVERKYEPLSFSDPFKNMEPIHLIDLILQATDFEQNGNEFTVIADKEYKLDMQQFKKIKAIAVGQVHPISDISSGIADGLLWYNGECQEPDGSLVYKQIFRTTKEKVGEILGANDVVVDDFKKAIKKVNG